MVDDADTVCLAETAPLVGVAGVETDGRETLGLPLLQDGFVLEGLSLEVLHWLALGQGLGRHFGLHPFGGLVAGQSVHQVLFLEEVLVFLLGEGALSLDGDVLGLVLLVQLALEYLVTHVLFILAQEGLFPEQTHLADV